MIDTLSEPQRALPHSEEAERAVLAAVLLDPPLLAAMAGRLVPEDFYGERHQLLYKAMLDLQAQATEIDLRTLQARLEQQDQLERVGGIAYLSGLDLDLPDLGRAETYVEIVKERSLRRRLIRACGEITRDCLDGGLEAAQALGRAEEAILTLGEEAIPRGFEAIGDDRRLDPRRPRGAHPLGDDRGRDRVQGLRRDDPRPEQEQPGDHRGPSGHGQDELRDQYRAVRLDPHAQAGRACSRSR